MRNFVKKILIVLPAVATLHQQGVMMVSSLQAEVGNEEFVRNEENKDGVFDFAGFGVRYVITDSSDSTAAIAFAVGQPTEANFDFN